MTWMRPFQGGENDEVEIWDASEKFPSLDGMAMAQSISDCWNMV